MQEASGAHRPTSAVLARGRKEEAPTDAVFRQRAPPSLVFLDIEVHEHIELSPTSQGPTHIAMGRRTTHCVHVTLQMLHIFRSLALHESVLIGVARTASPPLTGGIAMLTKLLVTAVLMVTKDALNGAGYATNKTTYDTST